MLFRHHQNCLHQMRVLAMREAAYLVRHSAETAYALS